MVRAACHMPEARGTPRRGGGGENVGRMFVKVCLQIHALEGRCGPDFLNYCWLTRRKCVEHYEKCCGQGREQKKVENGSKHKSLV